MSKRSDSLYVRDIKEAIEALKSEVLHEYTNI
jgi:hypothetical protein